MGRVRRPGGQGLEVKQDKTVTSEFVQPKKSILSLRKLKKFTFHLNVCCVLLLSVTLLKLMIGLKIF